MQATCKRKVKAGTENSANASGMQRKTKRAHKTMQMQAVCKENKAGTRNGVNASDMQRKQSRQAKRCKCKRYAKKTNAGVAKPNLHA